MTAVQLVPDETAPRDFVAEARAQLAGTTPDEAAALILGELLRVHARVDDIEAMAQGFAATFAQLSSGGLGGMLAGLFGKG